MSDSATAAPPQPVTTEPANPAPVQHGPSAQNPPVPAAAEAEASAASNNPDDSSLSAIQAFNQSFPGTPADTNGNPNEWGKRPAETDAADEANKRQHLEDVNEHADLFLAAAAGSAFPDAPPEPEPAETEPEPEDDGGDPDYQDEGEEDDDEEEVDHEQAPYIPQPNLNLLDPSTYIFWDATQTLRIQSLPILDNLSTQILQTLGKGPYQETLNIVTQPESDQGQAYNTMKSLFDQTKKLYTHEAFLSADDLKLDRPEQRATIRKVNLATFVSSVFGSQEVGFFHLNEHFLDTFVPDGGRLLKSQGALYLDLKTQAYISAMSTNERGKEEILEDLFPENMKDILFARRPGAKSLTPSEQDFVLRLSQRRAHLRDTADDFNLSEKYVWQDFLKEVSWYVSKNYEAIVAQPSAIKPNRSKRRPSASGNSQAHMSHPPSQPMMPPLPHHPPDVDAATAAALMAHTAAQHVPHSSAPDNAQSQLDNDLFGHPNMTYMGVPPPAAPPVPQQSAPTQVLYERARLAATSKASPNARRAGLPSQRRPWSTEEENALMAGLDRVKGPHWSQILAMFGPGGTVSEALKDRNQVQLKDKARNLKLFFLKSGIEVPYYLQFVTGELKTRAPGQAAKNAAKKQVEEHAAEDAAHVAAVTALGNVHRDNSNGLDLEMLQRDREHRLQVEEQLQAEHEAQEGEEEAAERAEQMEPPAAPANNNAPIPAPPQPEQPSAAQDTTMTDAPPPPPQLQQSESVEEQAPQAPMASMAPVASMAPAAAPVPPQTEKLAEAAATEGQQPQQGQAQLMGVDPALRTEVGGHQVSAERGT